MGAAVLVLFRGKCSTILAHDCLEYVGVWLIDGAGQCARDGFLPASESPSGLGSVEVGVPKVRSHSGGGVKSNSQRARPTGAAAAGVTAPLPWPSLEGICQRRTGSDRGQLASIGIGSLADAYGDVRRERLRGAPQLIPGMAIEGLALGSFGYFVRAGSELDRSRVDIESPCLYRIMSSTTTTTTPVFALSRVPVRCEEKAKCREQAKSRLPIDCLRT